MRPLEALKAMRADSIPSAESGLWYVSRWYATQRTPTRKGQWIPPGQYTSLRRLTDGTLHHGGQTVMSDDPVELRRHLSFVLCAWGDVLLTGLGLGCALRGLLRNSAVLWVDVVERDPDVLKLVEAYLPSGRFRIHRADALEWIRANERRWDCAWHDLWTDPDVGEPGLPVLHRRLMLSLRGRVHSQGAWNYPRHLQRVLREVFPSTGAWSRTSRRRRQG